MVAKDTSVFAPGDSGKTTTTMDTINGFVWGEDKTNLNAFGPISFEQMGYRADGKASFHYCGNYLRIDSDGNGTTDMMVRLMCVDSLKASCFVLA